MIEVILRMSGLDTCKLTNTMFEHVYVFVNLTYV